MSFLNNAQKKSTVLITAGSSGIGLGLAKFLLAIGHDVIVADRNQLKLDNAKSETPKLVTICVDLSCENQRKALQHRILSEYPQVNVLINAANLNANPPPLNQEADNDWNLHAQELQVNFLAPLHLCVLLLPHLQSQSEALIVNVSSIFAFFPIASHPAFCAAKAGLHSFTQSLRQQLKDTAIQVVEIVPPLINSPSQAEEFRGEGMELEAFVKGAMKQLLQGEAEIGVGGEETDKVLRGSRADLDTLFEKYNSHGSVCGSSQKSGIPMI